MLIRYPGSKAKLAAAILTHFPDEFRFALWAAESPRTYVEPFFGAGAIGFEVLRILPPSAHVVLNDIDIGIASLWRAVLKSPKQLQRMIADFTPTAEAFYEFKRNDGSHAGGDVACGFRKLALHQMSVSGFGAMSGGPLGGRDQRNASYPVDCRWNAERLQRHVAASHKILRKFSDLTVLNGDYSEAIQLAASGDFIYADPPYVKAGPALYKHSMDDTDHRRFAEVIRQSQAGWAVSYDDHELVREIFDGCNVTEIDTRYSNAVTRTGERPKNKEVVITPA